MGLLRLFRSDDLPARPVDDPVRSSPADWIPILPSADLLAHHDRTLAQIRQQVGVPSAHWNVLYQPMFERYAAFVQQLPASEAHHHRERGGLLSHALETTLKALTIRRGVLLPPNASVEHLADTQDVWTYATSSAALLHDLGKPVVDQDITLCDAGGTKFGRWKPLAGAMSANESPPVAGYSIRYVRGRRFRLHSHLPPMLVHHILPCVALEWLSRDLDVFEAWLATISGGDSELAGELGQIVKQADGLSVASNLHGGPVEPAAMGARRSFGERLALALRKLIDSEALPLNRPGAAGFVIDDDLWLVSKRALDALRDELSTESAAGVPSRNERLMDELQQSGILMPNGDRAIWSATVELAEWRQRLTLLRFPLARLWSDPAARPKATVGRVVPDETSVTNLGPGQAPLEVTAEIPPQTVTTVSETRNPRVGFVQEESFALPPLPTESSMAQAEVEAGIAVSESAIPPLAISAITSSLDPDARASVPHVSGVDASGALLDNDTIQWLIQGLSAGRLKINTPDARLHTTREGLLLVSPGIFRDFAGMDGWLKAQRRLIKLKAHLRTPDRANIWTYRVVGARKSSALLKGILIADAESRLDLRLPAANQHLALVTVSSAGTKQASSQGQVG